MKTFVTVKTSFEGIHCFPEAPKEVEFLRQEHRHMFGVTAMVEVYTDDREIEFIMMKHRINDWLSRQQDECGVWNMDRTSCEQVAKKILSVLIDNFDMDGRQYMISVDEDGENGASIVGTYELLDVLKENEKEAKPKTKKQPPKKTERSSMDGYQLSLCEYQHQAYKAIQEHANKKEEIMHWAIGLGEEAGEALSVIKHKYYGGNFDAMDLVGELGDTLWYIAAMCSAFNISLDDIAQYNLAKLNYRYPEKEFNDLRSKERHQLGSKFRFTSTYDFFKDRIEDNIITEDEEDEKF